MRLLVLGLLVLVTPAAAQLPADTLYYAEAGLTLALPFGFDEEYGAVDEPLGRRHHVFVDSASGRLIRIEAHTAFSAEERRAWRTGAIAARTHDGFMDRAERLDPSALGFPGEVVYAVEGELGARVHGYDVYGCDAVRCYRIVALAFAGDAAEPVLRAAVASVRFDR